jgi:chitin disaccharide deacetylase
VKSVLLIAGFAIMMIHGVSLADEIRLIVRGDDLGMTQGSLIAFEKAFNAGVLACGSVLVPAPWFEGAAALCRKNPGWCMGVHLSLVGEWQGYRWRPVLPWDRVPSIVDEDGYFYTHPKELFAKKPKIEEIEAELRAQIKLALRRGIEIRYLDTHYMGSRDYPGLGGVVERISRENHLPISGLIGEKRLGGVYKAPVEQKEEMALKMLENLQPGLWLWVVHIGIDSPEQNALVHSAVEDQFEFPGAGAHRAAELKVVMSAKVRSMIARKGIRVTDYSEVNGESSKRKGKEQRN